MTGGRARFPGRSWSLRTRLLISSLALIAVVCATVSVVTAVALHTQLYEQLDKQLTGVVLRAQHPPSLGEPLSPADTQPLGFVTGPGQQIGTLGAIVQNGQVTGGEYSALSSNQRAVTDVLGAAQRAALTTVPGDNQPHTVELPGLGGYRVEYVRNDG